MPSFFVRVSAASYRISRQRATCTLCCSLKMLLPAPAFQLHPPNPAPAKTVASPVAPSAEFAKTNSFPRCLAAAKAAPLPPITPSQPRSTRPLQGNARGAISPAHPRPRRDASFSRGPNFLSAHPGAAKAAPLPHYTLPAPKFAKTNFLSRSTRPPWRCQDSASSPEKTLLLWTGVVRMTAF
jgi:hypothetical protein